MTVHIQIMARDDTDDLAAEKGSGAKVRCGRRKDGTTSGGCGRDLFA